MTDFRPKRICRLCKKSFTPYSFAQEICLDCADKL